MSAPRLLAVTGAGGFVGRSFAERAVARGFRLRALVREGGERPPHVHECVAVNLASGAPMDERVLTGCETVVHLAAHIPRVQTDPAEAELCWRTNALGSLRLLECAIAAGAASFVQTVAANAYHPDVLLADEHTAMMPVSRATYYLASKLGQELYTTFRARQEDIAVSHLRVGSIYGAQQVSGAIPRIARRLLHGLPAQLVNGGTYGADFVTVAQVCEAIFAVAEQQYRGPLNVGSGRRRTLREVADILLRETGRSADLVEEVANPQDDPGFPALDISRARRLGLEPVQLELGLAEMVSELRSELG